MVTTIGSPWFDAVTSSQMVCGICSWMSVAAAPVSVDFEAAAVV